MKPTDTIWKNDADAGPSGAAENAGLFSPYTLRGVTLANRICVSPMSQYSADQAGRATGWHHMHYGNLAVSGAALVIVEATYVSGPARSTPGDLGLWNEQQAEDLRDVLTFGRRHGGARFGIQLSHAGRKGGMPIPWEDGTPDGLAVLGPSAIAFPGRKVPEMMSEAQIDEVVRDFARTTELARKAGFDLIELHCGHGYLLHSFLSPISNQRDDAYGGDLARRMRLPLDVFAAVRAAWPADRPLGLRLTCTDWMDGGWDLDDSVVFARELRKRGCDYVVASSGGVSTLQKIRYGPGYQVPFAERIRHEADLPTMAIGMVTSPRQAESIVTENRADLIGIGRSMLYNPRWAWHAAEALGADVEFPPQYRRAVVQFIPRLGASPADGVAKSKAPHRAR